MRRRRAAAGAPEGALVVDKPAGPTSHDVVATARRALGQPRVGHTGTLDPQATGVLPLLLGRATRLAQFLSTSRKSYEAHVRFGQATSSYDAAGDPIGPAQDIVVDPARLELALDAFRGTFTQTPPAVSAKQVGGRRAYDLARADQPVTLAPVSVEVHELVLVDVQGPTAQLRVTCSAGFYVRALAHDLGIALGTGAHLAALRRTRSGAFTLEEAVSLDQLVQDAASVAGSVLPLAAILADWPMVTASARGCDRLAHGQMLSVTDLAAPAPHQAGRMRVMTEAGELAALADWRAGALHPFLVLV